MSEESPVKAPVAKTIKPRSRYQEIDEVEEERSSLRMTTPKVPKLSQQDLQNMDPTPGKVDSHRVEALESIHDSLNEDFPPNVIADDTLQECRPSRMKALAGSTS